jgi:hypothetical protein
MLALLSLSFALPAFAMTYKSSYFNPYSEVRVAVKDVPGNPESHKVVQNDEAKMHADDEAQHTAHVNISGTVLQRTNHVTLVSRAPGCEMQVVLNLQRMGTQRQG